MTELDHDVDPRLEALMRDTFATVAATSHIVDDTGVAPAVPRWPKIAAALLILAGLGATALAVRPTGEPAPGSAAPGWYEWLSPQLPDGFVHVAVLESNEDYVTFEGVNLGTAMMLIFTVSRRPIAPDPNGSITAAELAERTIDIDQDLNVSLPDGRQIGVDCAIPSPDRSAVCSSVDSAPTDDDLRSLAQRLTTLPPDQLPAIDARVPVLDRTSLAAAAAFDSIGLGATAGSETRQLMLVSIGENDVVDVAPMQIRSVSGYFPPVDPAATATQSSTVEDVTITWSAMPDGSVWTIASRSPIDSSAPAEVLARIATRLSDGSVPTFPIPDTTTPPPTTPSFSSAPISSFDALGPDQTRTIVDNDDESMIARYGSGATAP